MGRSSLSFHLQILGLGKSRDKFFWASLPTSWPDLTSRDEITELKVLLKSNRIHCPKISAGMTQKLPAQWEFIYDDQCTWLQGPDIPGIYVSTSSYQDLFSVTSPIPILLPLFTLASSVASSFTSEWWQKTGQLQMPQIAFSNWHARGR